MLLYFRAAVDAANPSGFFFQIFFSYLGGFVALLLGFCMISFCLTCGLKAVHDGLLKVCGNHLSKCVEDGIDIWIWSWICSLRVGSKVSMIWFDPTAHKLRD